MTSMISVYGIFIHALVTHQDVSRISIKTILAFEILGAFAVDAGYEIPQYHPGSANKSQDNMKG